MSRGKKAKKLKDCGHPRLLSREKPEWREKLCDSQGNICPICGLAVEATTGALDHCHRTGFVRGTLHMGCNALLGKCENNYKRMGISMEQLEGISPRIASFLKADYSGNPYHCDHRTSEEKRLSRNERARKSRAKT